MRCRSFNPTYHAIARTAQDYERNGHVRRGGGSRTGVLGRLDRLYPETFLDYFRQISEFEPTRAAEYGIRIFPGRRESQGS